MAFRDDPALAGSRARHFASFGWPHGSSDQRRNVIDFRSHPPSCPEINCLRGRLPRHTLAIAERRAAALGVGADRALIAEGTIAEDAYLAALAASLGLEYEVLDDLSRDACPLDDKRLLDAAATGLLPIVERGQLYWVIAPRNLAARTLTRFIARQPGAAARFRLTSNAQLNRFIAVYGYHAQGARAGSDLSSERPDLSAAPRPWRLTAKLALAAAAIPAAIVAFPDATMTAVQVALAGCFLAALLMRLVGSFIPLPPSKPVYIPDKALPVYTIIVALYREARAVEGLIGALRALDYPPEKLDLIIVIEADDAATWSALSRLKLATPFEIITAPNIGPRTKPKALNAALPFARGTFTAVYDAEDRPEPDQLRRALGAFKSEDDELACVQACLTIDNTPDGILSRLFTAEYAAQFDLFLPGLAALRLPLPLGGSSNHFRTSVLRDVAAWDPYNVTEDADLGVRLARFGYRTTVVRSSTYEEAPARLWPWLCQRTRWFKGWMQTWTVHMRSPLRLLRELGPAGFMSFQFVIGGSVLAALVHPFFLAGLAYSLMSRNPFFGATLGWLYGTTLGAGYLISMLLGLRGLARRGLLSEAWALLFVPVHWLLLSVAAWRAVYQILMDPYRWEKTEHGLANSSRLARMTSRTRLRRLFQPGDREPRREAAE